MTLIVSVNSALLNTTSVQAATSDNVTTDTNGNSSDTKTKVKLENIREIMIENSQTMKEYENNLKIAKENYTYSKDQYGSISAIKDDITNTQTEINDFQAPIGSDGTPNNDENTNGLKTLKDKLQTYENNLSTEVANQYSYRKANEDYDKNVETAVYTAQGDYLSYLSTLAQLELQQDTVKSKDRDANVSKLSYDYGYVSKNDYITSTENNTDADVKLKSLIDEEALEKSKLCHELGVDKDAAMFEVDVNEDFQKIGQINYENDLKVMLDNSITLKQANDTINKLDESIDISDLEDNNSSSSDESDHTDTINKYNSDNNEIDLEVSTTKAKDSFLEQYNTLMNSYNSIKSSYDKLTQEQNVYQSKQTQYDYGYIAKNDVDDAKLTYDTDKADFIKSRNECYLEYLRYSQMKEGY